MKVSKYFKDRFRFQGICDVEEQYTYYFNYLLSKVNSIFIWDNLPDTIDENFLNNVLNLNGMIAFFKNGEDLVVMDCGYGGGPNMYYVPEIAIVANPIIGSKELEIDKDCVVMYNSSTDQYCNTGLQPLIKQYATLMADNIVSLNTAQINSRVSTMFAADSTALKNSAEITLKQLYAGKPYAVVEQDLLDSIHVNPLSTSDNTRAIESLVELNNYILANFYKSIGIFANNVMKKERLITDEISSQLDQAQFNIYDLLKQRTIAVEKINKMFGTDIGVRLNPLICVEDQTLEEIEDSAPETATETAPETEENFEEKETKNLEEKTEENTLEVEAKEKEEEVEKK